jgi:hypothetical protein
MAQASTGAGGGRGGIGGPRAGEREAYEAGRSRAEIPVDPRLKAPAASGRIPGETERNVRNILTASSGLTGMIPRAAAAAKPTSRAVAVPETPVTFLGASGRRNITPTERIGTTSRRALEGEDEMAMLPMKKGGKVKKAPVSKPKPKPKMSSASRADGMAKRGKTKGRFV